MGSDTLRLSTAVKGHRKKKCLPEKGLRRVYVAICACVLSVCVCVCIVCVGMRVSSGYKLLFRINSGGRYTL